jgi:hypothetical protein
MDLVRRHSDKLLSSPPVTNELTARPFALFSSCLLTHSLSAAAAVQAYTHDLSPPRIILDTIHQLVQASSWFVLLFVLFMWFRIVASESAVGGCLLCAVE